MRENQGSQKQYEIYVYEIRLLSQNMLCIWKKKDL